jgi:NAD+ diphosphatase
MGWIGNHIGDRRFELARALEAARACPMSGAGSNWLSDSPVDRLAEIRALPDAVAERWHAPNCRILPVVRGKHPMGPEGPLAFPPRALPGVELERTTLLGEWEGHTYFAAAVDAVDPSWAGPVSLEHLRFLGALLESGRASLLAMARAFTWWHRQCAHCGACGGATRARDGGHRRRCDACEQDLYPRVDPAVIVLVEHGDACLLARSPRFPPGMLSCLAGFVEPGENLEDCVRREVFEEVGVRVRDVRYQGSQPWPFPQSLMVGFVATAEDRALTLEPREIEAARWIERELLADPERWDDFVVPPEFTIARRLMNAWIEADSTSP